MMISEELLDDLEKLSDFLDDDSIEKIPIWNINGLMRQRLSFNDKDIVSTIGISFTDFSSLEEAEKRITELKDDPKWSQETLFKDKSHWPIPHLEYHGPIDFSSLKIIETVKFPEQL